MMNQGLASATPPPAPGQRVFLSRLVIAAAQAGLLYWLTEAFTAPRTWPATQPWLFEPLLLIAGYVPLLALLGAGRLAPRALAIWAASAGVIIAALGYHDATRGGIGDWNSVEGLPWPELTAGLTLALFIANVLVTDGVTEGRLRPPYPRHFDTAWKQAVQTVLAAVFVGVVWIVLWLGASLFKLLDIDYFEHLLTKTWFSIPATNLALAVAIHVSDVQPALIRGARSLALTLFSWLTPLLAVIILGFLASLPFVSLQPLWRTHFATGLMLSAALGLIFLINCCYQDGAGEQTRSRVKRLAATLAAIELTPLIALAAWGLALRVEQYGWSVQRVFAAAMILAGGGYALGYLVAVARGPWWLKPLEFTNWLCAHGVVVLVLCLFSPIADPARLMVADQTARLASGRAAPETFDYAALKFDGAGWGEAALKALRHGRLASNAAAQARIAQALAATSRWQARFAAPPTPAALAGQIDVYPAGRSLPKAVLDSLARTEAPFNSANCAARAESAVRCFARFFTLAPGRPEAIVFVDDVRNSIFFEQDAQGPWRESGVLGGRIGCVDQALRTGLITPTPHTAPDLMVGGERLTIDPVDSGGACPAAAAVKP